MGNMRTFTRIQFTDGDPVEVTSALFARTLDPDDPPGTLVLLDPNQNPIVTVTKTPDGYAVTTP